MDERDPFPGFKDPLTQHFDYRALRHDERTASAWVPMRDDLCRSDGHLRRGLLGYLVDSTAGVVCGMAAVPNWVVTADLQFRMLAEPAVGPLRADAEVRRPGRRQSLGEVTVHDEGAGDRPIATGTVNHIVIPKSEDLDVPADMPIGVTYVRETPGAGPPEDLLTTLGVTDDGTSVQLPIAGIAVNPLGFLHGGLISLMVERQVELSLDAPMSDLMIRFVGPVAVGTARTIPSLHSGPEGPVLHVDVVDDTGRPAAIASARPPSELA